MAHPPLPFKEGNSQRREEPARLVTTLRRHPLECQFLHSHRGLRDVDIPFRIDCDLVACSKNPRRLNIADNLQRLAIENENAISTADVKVLLVRIWRQREVARKRNVGLDELLH